MARSSNNTTFRSAAFDPALLVAQMVALQCSYYLSLSFVILLFELLMGAPMSVRHLLVFNEVDPSTALGWSLVLAFLASAVVTCFLALYIVERSRLCLDFACTLHGFHTLFVWMYSGRFPNSLFWWLTVAASTTILALGSQYLCMQRELEPIQLGSTGRNASGSAAGNGSTGTAPDGGNGGASGWRRRLDGQPADAVELERLNAPVV
ncbi:integral membrane protein S linking to the trans Golgi network-domain-containing protein [Entophlyctis helioformis]|nr:integral membrane protein S linking to the trans Golgi network-domain-containing protein [Entophlyctis helioformis]